MPDSLDCDIDQMIVNSGAHLGFLTHALKEMGVPQAGACRYDFPVTTAREFVELASKIAGELPTFFFSLYSLACVTMIYLTEAYVEL